MARRRARVETPKQPLNGLELLAKRALMEHASRALSPETCLSSELLRKQKMQKERKSRVQREKESEELGNVHSRRLLWKVLCPESQASRPYPVPTEHEEAMQRAKAYSAPLAQRERRGAKVQQ